MADRLRLSHGAIALRIQAMALGMVRGADLAGPVALEVGEAGVLLLPDDAGGAGRALRLSSTPSKGWAPRARR